MKLSGILLLAVLAADSISLAAEVEPEWRYNVRPGDTLIGFSRHHLKNPADWSKLHVYNALTDPHRLVPGQTLRIPVSLLKQIPAPAEVVAVSGRVQAIGPGAALHDAAVKEKLFAGAVLRTGADSSAALRFADGSMLMLQPNSSVQMDTISMYGGSGMVDTRLRVQEGRVEILANPAHTPGNRTEVTTPSAVAAVRGTRFRVAADDTATREETLEGAVALAAAGQEIELPGGYGSVTEKGKPPGQPLALLPAPDLGGLPARVEQLPIRFDLPAREGAARWIGQIASDAGFDRILLEKYSDAPHLAFADLPDGVYVLRVRAEDKLGLHGRDSLHRFELDARPFPPLLLAPADNGIVRTAMPGLEWSKAQGADAYRVELASDAGFVHKLLDETTVSTRLPLTHELSPGDYFLRVASISNGDTGPFAKTVKFSYSPPPGAPDLANPVLRFGRNMMHVNLPLPPEGLHYEVELAANESRDPVFWRGDSHDGKIQMPRPPAGKHHLSVRMVESDGTAGPYATQAIDVPPRQHWEVLMFLLPLLAI